MLNNVIPIKLIKKCKQKRFSSLEQMPPTDKLFEYLLLDTIGGFNHHNSTKKYPHLVVDHVTQYVWGIFLKKM